MAKADDDVLALERRLIRAAAGDWLGRLAALRLMVATEAPGVVEAVLTLLAPSISAEALAGLDEAFRFGVDAAAVATHSLEPKKRAGLVRRARRDPPSPSPLIGGIDADAATALAQAWALAAVGGAPELVAAPLLKHAGDLERLLVTEFNATANDGILAAAKADKRDVVWVAERDACLHCLAMQGRVATAGEDFASHTYAAGPIATPPGGLPHPPRHPRCRCRIEILFDQSYADALRREADRSVLRGWSNGSDSDKARVGAAERLLAKDPTAPASVKKVAGDAVKKGSFRGARVPKPGPTV